MCEYELDIVALSLNANHYMSLEHHHRQEKLENSLLEFFFYLEDVTKV